VDIAELALARQREMSTDLGVGVAVPHARCPNLAKPLLVFGRAPEGLLFSAQSGELVRLVFLLVVPSERPEVQLHLLARLARIAGDQSARERLLAAVTESEVIDVLFEAREGKSN
jgi:PTS system nitrogen regulatory IIA component